MEPNDYLLTVKTTIVTNFVISGWEIVREDAQDSDGIYRYRLTLIDGSFLEAFERFEATDQGLDIRKYSFHWQEADGQLRRRWDNANHHPELPGYPHHVHLMSKDGTTSIVSSHQPSFVDILEIVAEDITTSRKTRQ